MVEGGGLENRKARKGLGGSNPSSSATVFLYIIEIITLIQEKTSSLLLGIPLWDLSKCQPPRGRPRLYRPISADLEQEHPTSARQLASAAPHVPGPRHHGSRLPLSLGLG